MARKSKQERTLSEAEQRRLAQFEQTAADMEQQGYRRHDLTIDIIKANVFALWLLIPLFIIGYGLFYLVNHQLASSHSGMLAFLVAFVVLIVVHELIHGACWSIFAPRHFKDIEFGIMRNTLTPYCTCLAPLNKGQYIFGAVMPLVVLGILPMIAGIVIGDSNILLLGIVMADAAAGDIMIIRMILGYKSNASEIVYIDHPTDAGGVVFER